ncbi:unnamed protein product [Moneuplotes crassus]|uniref:Uncharacterized protein n=1 Tax=Euplotes crassus TaxID=5936 RepID=A0AAD1U423_EUPCR|nr:unnamed protein product [Moneuplotes crassus]
MKFPKCQHKGCREAAACYLSEKKLYLCQQHRFAQYPEDNSVLLVDDSTVETNLKAIQICSKDFLAFTQMLNNGSISADEDDLSKTIKGELNYISDELKEAQKTCKYYEFCELLGKTLDIKDVLEQHHLYVKYLVTRAWNKSLSIAKGKSLKSSEVVEMELKREYEATFGTISEKFIQMRRKIERRHQEEMFNSKITLERSMTNLRKNYEEELNEKKRQYRNKRIQLKQKVKTLEENLASLKEENKRKDTVLHVLQEENAQACQELRRTKDELEESKQSAEDLADKLDEEIALSKDHQELLEAQKDLHDQSIAKLREAKDAELQALQDTLSAKEEELKKSELEKENLQTDKNNITKELISNLNLSKSSDLSNLYRIITGQEKQIGPETELALKLDNLKDMEFLTSLNKRMPEVARLDLYKIPLNCQEVKTFLATYFPNKVRELYFNSGSPLSNSLPFYLEELVEVIKRVTGHLYIYEFEVSQDQLVTLFSANRHQEWFGFSDCKLALYSVPDFGGTLAGSTMQVLSLRGCGKSSYGDWGNNDSHFENLIAGLSQEEDFRKNLEWIGLSGCGMKKNDVKKILADHGFGHVEIGEYSK